MGSSYSPYFPLIHDLIDSLVYRTSEQLQNILSTPEKYTLGDFITASERKISSPGGESERKIREIRMKYTRVMQALAKDNVYISYLNQEYSSYEKISPPLAFMREEWPTSKQKDVDIYIESTFGFGSESQMAFLLGIEPDQPTGCLDRSMGKSSHIGHHYLFSTPPSEQHLRARQYEIESILSSGQISAIFPLRYHGRGLAEISAGLENYLGESPHEDLEGFLWAYLYNNSYTDIRHSYNHPDVNSILKRNTFHFTKTSGLE